MVKNWLYYTKGRVKRSNLGPKGSNYAKIHKIWL